MREKDDDVWVTWMGERLRLSKVPAEPLPNSIFEAFVKSNRVRGGIARAYVYWKDGLYPIIQKHSISKEAYIKWKDSLNEAWWLKSKSRQRYGKESDVLALILESHTRE